MLFVFLFFVQDYSFCLNKFDIGINICSAVLAFVLLFLHRCLFPLLLFIYLVSFIYEKLFYQKWSHKHFFLFCCCWKVHHSNEHCWDSKCVLMKEGRFPVVQTSFNMAERVERVPLSLSGVSGILGLVSTKSMRWKRSPVSYRLHSTWSRDPRPSTVGVHCPMTVSSTPLMRVAATL